MDLIIWLAAGFLAVILVMLVREDLPFLLRPCRRVAGTVFDHQRSVDDGAEYFSVRVRFTDDGGRTIEIDDSYGRAMASPPVGSEIGVVYPLNMPQRGRVHRPILRLTIYVVVCFSLVVLLANGLGWTR